MQTQSYKDIINLRAIEVVLVLGQCLILDEKSF
jgi:hypothetical protein